MDYRLKDLLSRGLLHLVLLTGAISMILPFFWMFATSLKSGREVLARPHAWIPQAEYVMRDGEKLEVERIGEGTEPGSIMVIEKVPEQVGGRRSSVKPEPFEIAESELQSKVRFEWRNYYVAFMLDYSVPEEAKDWGLMKWTKEMFTGATFLRYFVNTIFISFSVLAGVLVTSCLAAYAFARFKFKGREPLFMGYLAMMMIPQPVYLVPSFLLLAKLGWLDTYKALIVPWLAHVFSIFLLRQHFKTIPDSLHDAAVIDGCSHLGFLWRVVIPLSKAVMVTVAIFSVIGNWNSFMWPLIMVNTDALRPIQVGLAKFYEAQGSEHHLMMAAATFSILPLIILYFFAQKQIMSSFTKSGIKE